MGAIPPPANWFAKVTAVTLRNWSAGAPGFNLRRRRSFASKLPPKSEFAVRADCIAWAKLTLAVDMVFFFVDPPVRPI